MGTYTPTRPELRELVDDGIRTYLERRRAEAPDSEVLVAEIERVVASGGKRLRPAFCYWGYRASGSGHDDRIIRAAITFELLHTFAIIHDDIMDSSAERRGQPTSFARLGLDGALLVGDLALVFADAALLSAGFGTDVVAAAYGSYSRMQQEVIAGQYLDVTAPNDIDPERARRIAHLKSGSYSIEGPLVVGAQLAGSGDELVAALRRVGVAAGEAFQLRDDLLGMFGDPAVTGKSTDADISDGKRNFLFATTAARATGPDRDRFRDGWGADRLTVEETAWLRALVESSGARAEAEGLIRDLERTAADELRSADIPEDARAALGDLIAAAVDRVA
jgi:geranylgeranyl diphosphate synthase type I